MRKKVRAAVLRWGAVLLTTGAMLAGSLTQAQFNGQAAEPATAPGRPSVDPAFVRVWQRTDGVVADGGAQRPWVWGPDALYSGVERFRGTNRPVQYWAKGRMELSPGLPGDAPQVTNGRLGAELVSGLVDLGNGQAQVGAPADIAIVGDAYGNDHVPTYASLRFVTSLNDDRRVPARLGQSVVETMARDGTIGVNPHLGGRAPIGAYSDETGHNIPSVFLDYLASVGPVSDGYQTFDETVIDAIFTVGFPLTEAYWTQAIIDGQPTDVLFQLWERRVLVYIPSRPAPYQVELGDIGRHYYQWRYHQGVTPGQPAQHRDLRLVVTGITRSTIEAGPAGLAPPAPAAEATPTVKSKRRQPTPTPAPPTPVPVPEGALQTSGVFIIAELMITNDGVTTATLALDEFIVVDSLGRRYEIHPEATVLASKRLGRQPDSNPGPGPIRPGFSIKAVRVWEVPATAQGLVMVPAFGEKPGLNLD